MSKKEEELTAIQNVGATTFAIGVIGGCMAGNPVTLTVSYTHLTLPTSIHV